MKYNANPNNKISLPKYAETFPNILLEIITLDFLFVANHAMGVMSLQMLGYSNVRGFPPSIQGWKAAGEPLEK